MSIFNSFETYLTICMQIIPNYPKVLKLGGALERRVEKVIEQEKDNREDLYHLAFGFVYILFLQSRC